MEEVLKEDEAITQPETSPARIHSDEVFEDKYLGEGLISRLQGFPISKDYLQTSTHEEVAEKLQQALLLNTGQDVTVEIDENLIPIKVAKAYATEIASLTKEYRLLQAPLGKVRIGYRSSHPFEYGETYYDHVKNSPKVLSVRECDEVRLPKVAIEASRCSKYRRGISVVSHEFGHVLYAVRTPQVAIPEFEKAIKAIYDEYEKEKGKALKTRNYEEMAKWYLGKHR